MPRTNACTPALAAPAPGEGRGCAPTKPTAGSGRKAAGRIAALVAAACLLSACETVRALTFQADESSGEEKFAKQTTRLFLIAKLAEDKEANAVQLPPTLKVPVEACVSNREIDPSKMTTTGAAALPVILIGLVIQQGLSLGKDAIAGYVESLQERGQQPYSGQLLLPRQAVVDGGCLLLVRADWKDKSEVPDGFGMALLSKLERIKLDSATGTSGSAESGGGNSATTGQFSGGSNTTAKPADASAAAPDAARLQILYAKLNNAVALTGKGKPVDVSVAFVGRAVRKVKGVPTIELFAQDTVTLNALPLPGQDVNDAAPGKQEGIVQASTGLLPMPPDDASAVEITIGIMESGSGVPDAKKAKAELEALEKALGPELVKAGRKLVAP